MITYCALSIERVLDIHDRIIVDVGGKEGIRDFTLLHSGLERCKVTFAGEDLYPTIYDKGSALLHSLIMNHPFLDGNKRTAFALTTAFLNSNGYFMTAPQDEIVRFCISVDNDGIRGKEIVRWLKKNTVKKEPTIF